MSKKCPRASNACNQIGAQIVCSCCFILLHIQCGWWWWSSTRGWCHHREHFSWYHQSGFCPLTLLPTLSPTSNVWSKFRRFSGQTHSRSLKTNFVTDKQYLKQNLLFLIKNCNTDSKYAGSLNIYLDVSTMALSEFSIESPKICYICYFLTHANPCKLSGQNATNVCYCWWHFWSNP